MRAALLLPQRHQMLRERRVFVAYGLQRRGAGQVKAQEFGSTAREAAGVKLVGSILVKCHEPVLRQLEILAREIVLFVPPSDGLGDVQVVGQHDQLDVADVAAKVEIARPPAFRAHIDDPPQLDLFRVVGGAFDNKVACDVVVFRTALQLERIMAGGEIERDRAGEDEMVAPKRVLRRFVWAVRRARQGACGRQRAYASSHRRRSAAACRRRLAQSGQQKARKAQQQ